MLNQAIAHANLVQTLKSRADFVPFPRYEDREAWQSLPKAVRHHYAELSALCAAEENSPLRATRYMDFIRNGDRSRYEQVYFDRRRRLVAMALAECMAADGALIDPIIDCLWAICEETTWVVPAHNNHFSHFSTSNALCDVENECYIDLFAAETGAQLSWVHYLLGERLAQESPLIPKRIAWEVERRVLRPYMAHGDFHWMGLAGDDPVNNWNPWINENVLASALLMVEEPERRVALATKIGASLQRFLDGYAPDGGCDEGPSYFNVAGGAMLDALALFDQATGGAVSLYDTDLIRNMASYIYIVHIDGEYHVNFADAPARVKPAAALLLRAGARMADEKLMEYARFALAQDFSELPYALPRFQLHRLLANLFDASSWELGHTGYKAVENHYFPGIEVAVGRQRADSPEGIFFAAKGGHNSESHNHNDIGNYLLYLDGQPVLVDAGVETYSRKTFSSQRYEIWTMQSQYHNTAIVNGQDQLPGRQYAAEGVAYAVEGGVTTFTVGMHAAYGKETRVRQYTRTLTFDRAAQAIAIDDSIQLEEAITPTVLPMLSAVEPVCEPGKVRFPVGERSLLLTYDAALFTARVETIALEDKRLLENWKRPALYRLLLTRTAQPLEDVFTLAYSIVRTC